MGEVKFTPGYWKAHKLSKPVGVAEWEIHWSNDGECVAEVVHGEVNAKLMAASKEMYEALKQIRQYMRSYPDGIFRDREIDMVDAAIAKAEEGQ